MAYTVADAVHRIFLSTVAQPTLRLYDVFCAFGISSPVKMRPSEDE